MAISGLRRRRQFGLPSNERRRQAGINNGKCPQIPRRLMRVAEEF